MIEAAKIHGGKWLAIEDPTSGQLTYKRLLQATAILGAKLMPLALEGRPIGVMLPTSNGAAVTVLALMSGGRVPAMINFTSGAANVLGACRAAQVDTILTAHAFVEKAQTREAHRGDRETGPHRLSGRHPQNRKFRATSCVARCGAKSRWSPASPTTGPSCCSLPAQKGVPRASSCPTATCCRTSRRPKPASISGVTTDCSWRCPRSIRSASWAASCCRSISGVPTYFYPSPLHYRTVPELVYGICATYMFGTDTFLAGYARMANAYDFRSLRYIIA